METHQSVLFALRNVFFCKSNKTGLFLLMFGLSLGVLAQSSVPITDVKEPFSGATLSDFITFVEKHSDYKFFLNNSEVDVNQSVQLPQGNASLYETIKSVLKGLNLTFRLTEENAIIIVSEKMQAEKISVSGTVKDGKTGEALLGVAVSLPGTTTGTITDVFGVYNMMAPANATLSFSFIGYETQNIALNGRTNMDVFLSASAFDLEEVVMIGYGTTTKRKAVGSIATMKAKELENTPFMNAGESLQGQVAGLVVQNSDGEPGSAPSISIRGGGTPLYVIDGVITEEQDFNAINSEDIESISFLKDASATAVFGSRAGNGIVLVTTKRGEEGKINVTYSYNHQWSQPTTMPRQLNSYEFAKMQNDATFYEGQGLYATYSEEQLGIIKNHKDLDLYPDNNWQDLGLKDFSQQKRHNLSLVGGDKRTNYFVSLGYVDQGGMLVTDNVNYDRFNVRSNMTTHFDKIGLEVGVNMNAGLENYEAPPTNMYAIWRALTETAGPLFRAYNADGSLAGGGNQLHPLAIISPESGYRRTRDKFINVQLQGKWSLPWVEGLKLGVMANFRDGDGWAKRWSVDVPLYMRDGTPVATIPPQLTVDSYYKKRLYLEQNLNYAKTFGKHGVEGTFVYSQTTVGGETVLAQRKDYLSDDVGQIVAGPSLGQLTDGNQTEGANAGYVIRAKYDYDYKYILEFSGRYDGNDNFAKEQRWGFFPAVSAAWNVSEENFMNTMNERNILNSLKLRFSYGVTGIDDDSGRFPYIPVYNIESNVYNVGGALVNGYSEGDLVDPARLTWYERKSLNYGLDFSSLGNRLSGTVEYFYYRTTGFLISPDNIYSQPLGKALPMINSESAHRRAGIEFLLRYKGEAGDFKYEVGGNMSSFNQVWERKDDEDMVTTKNPYLTEVGRTDYWAGGAVLTTSGLYQNNDDLLNTARLAASTATQHGDILYKDNNGDGKIDAQDKRFVASPSMPRINYGIDFKLSYKGWYMSGLFQGTGNRYVSFSNHMTQGAATRCLDYNLDYWTPDNRDALYPRIAMTWSVNGGNNSINTNPSDFYLKNAKYFRLKNMQIGYDFKERLLTRTPWLETFRVFVSGTNLLTISQVMDYFDPEQSADATDGMLSKGYPIQRTYSVGLNLGF